MQEKGHPQSLINIIGKYGCLGFCYIYMSGVDSENDVEYYRIMSDAIKSGVKVSGIRPDCYVENPELFFKWLTGRTVRVTAEAIATIKNIEKPTITRFYYHDENAIRHDHFVVCEAGVVVFDPTENSRTVQIGHPDSIRVITYI